MAISMLIVMLVLAVPVSYGSSKVAGQFARGSQTYDEVMKSEYSANAGIEYALWEIMHVPSFDSSLTLANPTGNLSLTTNGQNVDVTVTKIFGAGGGLVGQGIIPSKTVSPTTASVDTLTTFTYTIKVKNAGTEDVTLKDVTDYLPPRFSYVSNSTTGLTNAEPAVSTNDGLLMCGDRPPRVRWDVENLNIIMAPDEELTLTFQASGTLPAGTYYNQARVRYESWWDNNLIYVYTPYSAPVTVGGGTPKCGFNLSVLATKTVEPTETEVEVETEFTYTISLENVSSGTRYVCEIDDLLPPEFTYVTGSADDYPANVSLSEPVLTFEPTHQRWLMRWGDGTTPLVTMAAGGTKSQVFRSLATPTEGGSINNEFSIVWSDKSTCQGGSNGGTIQGGSAASIVVDQPIGYDILSESNNRAIKVRVHYYRMAEQMEVLSWQVN